MSLSIDGYMEPYVCGEDFCEACGDCMSCYGSDPCYANEGDGGDENEDGPFGPHQWSPRDEDDE